MQLRIDPRPEAKPIDGEFRLSGLDLAVARPFVPMVERLRGELNGSGQLAGSLQQPTLNGQLLLTGGEIAGSELPTTFEDLRVRLLIEGERLSIDGGWRAGEQGAAASAVRWIGRTSWTWTWPSRAAACRWWSSPTRISRSSRICASC